MHNLKHKADGHVSSQRVLEQQEDLWGHAVALAQGPVAHKRPGTTLACATGMPGFTLLSWAPSQGSSTATAGPVTLYCSRRQWVRPGRSKNTGRGAVFAVRVRDKSTIGGDKFVRTWNTKNASLNF